MSSPATGTPRDDFPPHGYLDNPWHSWKWHPRRVPRARHSAGMGWHSPNYGSSGRNHFQYRAHLHVGIEVAGQRLLTPAELQAARVPVGCDLRTKQRLRYVWTHPGGVRVTATCLLVDEHALGCRLTLERTAARDGSKTGDNLVVRLWLAQEVAHNPAASRLWEYGLYAVLPGASDPATGPLGLLGVCPEGDAWVHGATAVAGQPLLPAAAQHDRAPWPLGAGAPVPPPEREPPALQTATLLLAYDLVLPPYAAVMVDAILARGVSGDRALAQWHTARAGFAAALAARVDDDERFWRAAPQLSGHWPAHWRRGLVTDLETLRMTVRPPSGVFARAWDGMQIQAPRAVLAETALDALALAWADPVLARGIVLACFASAPRPNVPCMREDGSYNMVADDGAVCGTGPEWGWPLAVADALWRTSGDRDWLAALYPHAAAYLRWWLDTRMDGEGWLVHACSWESGQDVSRRVGTPKTGGSDVAPRRPGGLQGAPGPGVAAPAAWAAALERPAAEIARWRLDAEYLAQRTQSLWHDGWDRDYESRYRTWAKVRDPMQLAPLVAGVAAPEQAPPPPGALSHL